MTKLADLMTRLRLKVREAQLPPELEAKTSSMLEEAERLGAGEILLTSMDHDGTKNGFDIPLTKAIARNVRIPVIASGGAGKLEDFYNILHETQADAALAASVFHYGEMKIQDVKKYLTEKSVKVRL